MLGTLLEPLAVGLAITLMVLVVSQLVVVVWFACALLKPRPTQLSDAQCPPATVILCLRGGDPFLSRCIEGILTQDYPNYDLIVMLDHREDPAWPIVEEVVQRLQAKRVRLVPLENPHSTCSLKCSALAQAVELLAPETSFIASLDADTIPHKTWLRELATKLAEPGIGAATGNRWYMPPRCNVGSVVRYLWNSAAVPQMYLYRIGWGGTLAIKMEALRKVNLVDQWLKAFAEDTMTDSRISPSGMRLGFVPSLMMVNRETCELKGYFNWVIRQLLSAQLHHPRFDMVAVHGATTSLVPGISLMVGLVAWGMGSVAHAQMLLGALLIYQVSLLAMLVLLEWAVRRAIAYREAKTAWLSWGMLLMIPPAMLITQVVYASALLVVSRIRQVDWRGIRYRLQAKRVEMVQYIPYRAASTAVDGADEKSLHSL